MCNRAGTAVGESVSADFKDPRAKAKRKDKKGGGVERGGGEKKANKRKGMKLPPDSQIEDPEALRSYMESAVLVGYSDSEEEGEGEGSEKGEDGEDEGGEGESSDGEGESSDGDSDEGDDSDSDDSEDGLDSDGFEADERVERRAPLGGNADDEEQGGSSSSDSGRDAEELPVWKDKALPKKSAAATGAKGWGVNL